MLIVGLILLVLSLVLGSSALFWLAFLFVVGGSVLWLLGVAGRPVGGRSNWW